MNIQQKKNLTKSELAADISTMQPFNEFISISVWCPNESTLFVRIQICKLYVMVKEKHIIIQLIYNLSNLKNKN